MQTRREDLVELTLIWDEAQYRACFRYASRAYRRQRIRLAAFTLVLVAVWSLVGDPYWTFLAFSVLMVTGFVGWDLLRIERRCISVLKDSAYAPFTYRIGSDGVSVEGVNGCHSVRWCGVMKVESHSDFWLVHDVESAGFAIPRRLISTEDDAALATVFQHYSARIGEPWASAPATPEQQPLSQWAR